MKVFPIVLRIGGVDKEAKRGLRDITRSKRKDHIFSGLTSARLYYDGRKEFRVWVNSRQTEREFIETFFHEMTHVVCHLLKVKTVNEEALCRWVGYLAKSQFGDAKPSRFGRRVERRKRK